MIREERGTGLRDRRALAHCNSDTNISVVSSISTWEDCRTDENEVGTICLSKNES